MWNHPPVLLIKHRSGQLHIDYSYITAVTKNTENIVHTMLSFI